MRRSVVRVLTIAIFGVALGAARAATVDLSQWFLSATAYRDPGPSVKIATPDFMLGKSMYNPTQRSCIDIAGPEPIIFQTWQLLAYDRKHHIGFAILQTDAKARALFTASPPAVSVPDRDLSQCSTGRGLRIGSTYAQVLALYGPPAKHGRHFVTSYSALVPDAPKYGSHERTLDPEDITLVIDNGRVSSILIFIHCCNG